MLSSLCCRLLERAPQKLWQASNILALAMGHTTVTDPNSKNPHIKFDVELDLEPFMDPQSPELSNGGSLKYELIAVIQRIGKDVRSGHYVAYCNTNSGSGETSCNAAFAKQLPGCTAHCCCLTYRGTACLHDPADSWTLMQCEAYIINMQWSL